MVRERLRTTVLDLNKCELFTSTAHL